MSDHQKTVMVGWQKQPGLGRLECEVTQADMYGPTHARFRDGAEAPIYWNPSLYSYVWVGQGSDHLKQPV